MQINYAPSNNFNHSLLRNGSIVLLLHVLLVVIIHYGLPDFSFKKRPDLIIEFSTMRPSSGGLERSSPSQVAQKNHKNQNLMRDKDGQITERANQIAPASQQASSLGMPSASSDADYQSSYLKNPKPPYPPLAVKLRQEGQVILLAEILPTGKAGRVLIQKGSGHELLDQSALQTVSNWQFAPARKDGVIVSQVIRIPITFNLKSR